MKRTRTQHVRTDYNKSHGIHTKYTAIVKTTEVHFQDIDTKMPSLNIFSNDLISR